MSLRTLAWVGMVIAGLSAGILSTLGQAVPQTLPANPTPDSQPATARQNTPPPFNRRPATTRPNTRTRMDPSALTDAMVSDSINRGIDFLINDVNAQIERIEILHAGLQKSRPGISAQEVADMQSRLYGELALATYALLHAGHHLDDPRLKFGSDTMAPLVKMLTRLEIDETYITAVQACALAQLPKKPEYKQALTRVTSSLLRGLTRNGAYTYPLVDRKNYEDSWDNSNAQYGLLAVWAAAEWGIETPANYWRNVESHWRKVQNPDGGWGYMQGVGGSTNSMSAAGVASLLVCAQWTDFDIAVEGKVDAALDNGMSHLVNNFEPRTSDLYYLYGVERVGLASGYKFLKNANWYREGAATIVALQNADGSFNAAFIGASPMVNTSYAVLFLLRGRAPVLMNKLEYDGPWNNRPRDAANLVRFFSKEYELQLNWQVVPIDSPVDEWLDAPVLLITGSRDPKFTPQQILKLRQFVNAGGMIFSTSDGGREAFTQAMRTLAGKVTLNDYEMRILPKDHPLYSIEAKIKNPPKLWGLSNGVREIWVHSPTDFGAIWHANARARKDAWDIATNLYFYTTGKASLRNKLDTVVIKPRDPKLPLENKITLARIAYAGNWDPEPGAFTRFTKIMANHKTDLTVDDVKISKLNAAAEPYTLAHLTGTTGRDWTETEIIELREFVRRGGTLLIDSAGGRPTFTAATIDLLKKAWPDVRLEPLMPENPLYSAFCSQATAIKRFDYRKFFNITHGNIESPRLQALTIDGRLAVIFSQDDLTSGLLGTNTWGIDGYTAATSEALMRNLVLWPVRDKILAAPPATSPATLPAPK